MVVWLFLIVAFNEMNVSIGLILSMMFFLITYQLSLGPIAFIHSQDTCTSSAVGLANLIVFFNMMITSMITPVLADSIGISGCFLFFGCCTLTGIFYLHLFTKDSSFGIVKDTGALVALSDF